MATVPIDIRDAVRMGFRSERHMQRASDRLFRKKQEQLARVRQAEYAWRNDDIIFADYCVQLKLLCDVSLKEQELSDALQAHCSLMAFRIANGEEVSYEDSYRELNQIAEEHGFLSGVPVPLLEENDPDLVMAEGVPLAEIFHMNQEHRAHERRRATEMQEELSLRDVPVRNSWHALGDQTVCVIETEGGPMAFPRWDAGIRMRKLVHGMEVRYHAHQTAKAEYKALESLRTKISESQFDCYMVSGLFPEQSKRSGIFYYFRKGYPTIAVTFHGPNKDSGRVLACLCLHPMGYYSGTHCGLMTPTDEVIAHLLMMRADEHAFWKKSGQWSATDTRSGL